MRERKRKTIKRRKTRGKGGRESERKEGFADEALGLCFCFGRTLGAPTPRQPLNYKSFISAATPKSAGAVGSGGPGPSSSLITGSINIYLLLSSLGWIT